MSTYRALKGYSIKKLSSNPTNPKEGQIWYNSTTSRIKVQQSLAGAWVSSNAKLRLSEGPATIGSQTGMVAVGGYAPGGHTNAVDEYNGTTYSVAANYPSTNYAGQGGGTSTAGIIAGGNQTGSTFLNGSYTWDGSSWTSAPNINKARNGCATSIGTATAALIHGGYDNASPLAGRDETEEFNGTSWSEQNDLSTGRSHGGSGGTQTAGIYFCGETTNTGTFNTRCPNTTEEYDGTSWSGGGTVPGNFTRLNGSGLQTACFRIGGASPSVVSTTDYYNGSSWASAAALGTAQNWASSGGTGANDSIIGGGRGSSTYTSVTQEYSNPQVTTRSVDVS